MRRRGVSCWLVIIGIVVLATAAMPDVSDAHRRHGHFSIGIGPGWWGPWWGYPAYPYPVPVAPPCRDIWVEGRRTRTIRSDAHGFTTYHDVWVPGHWERVCP